MRTLIVGLGLCALVGCRGGEGPTATTPASASPPAASPAAASPAAASPAASAAPADDMPSADAASSSTKERGCLGQPALDGGGMCEAPAVDDRGRFRDENLAAKPLGTCSTDPMTGWFRDGRCSSGPRDRGVHVVCAEMTESFLAFTKTRGNDLSTPAPRYGFPGLKPGDRWCLCAARWDEARRAGKAPPVILDATHAAALRIVDEDDLRAHAVGDG